MTFSRPSLCRLVPVLLLLALGCFTAGAYAQLPSDGPVLAVEAQPRVEGPHLRVIERSAEGVTYEVRAGWPGSLSEIASAEEHRVVLAAVGGLPVLSDRIDLPGLAAPMVTVTSAEFDETPLTFVPGETDGVSLVGPAAAVESVGLERRRPAGTLVVRLLQADPEARVLRRYTRLVVRVQYAGSGATTLTAARPDTPTNPHLAVTRSVLAEGTWFKVPVTREGIYRIDRGFLSRLGLNPDGIDPDRVQVFGNSGAPLPALNRAPRIADLAENARYVVGGGDGRFNEGDAVYFYADAASGWMWDPAEAAAGRPGWRHYLNPFSRENFYFIRVDGPAGQTVGMGSSLAGDAAVRDRVEGRVFVEEDSDDGMVNREGGGSGLDWLGRSLSRTTNLITVLDTIPDGIAAGTVRYRGRLAARSEMPVQMAFERGGTPLSSGTVPAALGNELFRDDVRLFSEEATAGQRLRLSLRLSAGSGNPIGWIDYVQAFYPQDLRATQDHLRFVTPGGEEGLFEFVLRGFSAEPQVWDVTETGGVRRLATVRQGETYRVRVRVEDGVHPRELVAFVPSSPRVRTLDPTGAASVPNQNLHGIAGFPDYVIVTAAPFMAAAEELAAHRAEGGLRPLVVDIQQIYNEFSGGLVDPRGLRDYLRFLYDRGPGDTPALENVLLLGNGHYDYRGIKGIGDQLNWIPTYQTQNSSSYIASYTSDDYFGLLDPDEGVWEFTSRGSAERLDIGIGRLPVNTAADAAAVVRKIKRYEDPATQGAWRTRYSLLADDHRPNVWDTDLHVQNAEVVGENVQATVPGMNLEKVYMAMYPLQQTALGARYPAATADVLRGLEEGRLLWNYSGHGGPMALADERLITREEINALTNFDRLTIGITATCSFGRYDLTDEQSAGEAFVINPHGGAVALFTTNRVVFASSSPSLNNLGINVTLNRYLLTLDDEGRPRRLGEAYRLAKASNVGSQLNNRKFNLLGDPGLRIGMPERPVRIAAINGVPTDAEGAAPEFRAQELATVSGEVLGLDGRLDPAYQGEVELLVYDVERTQSLPAEVPRAYTDGTFQSRSDLLYRGRASVQNGRWEAQFIVPRDVSYAGRSARVSAYVSSGSGLDGQGFSEAARVSVEAGTPVADREGPRIQLFLNDTTFVSGGLVGSDPVLIARLADESGINVAGAGVGHEMLLTVNGRTGDAIDLSQYYRSDLDTYRSGTVRFPLGDLPPGPHTLSITAWDVVNNASTATLDFVIADSERLRIAHAYPYPNPTTGPTRFVFEHNQMPGSSARVQIRIYTINGRPIRTLDGIETLPDGTLPGSPVQILWDGRDEDFDLLATGVYLYKVRVEVDDPGGNTRVAEQIERLAIIR